MAATEEIVGKLPWRNLRLVAHNPHTASEAQTFRQEKIKAVEAQAMAWVGELDAQNNGVKARGKKPSDSGANGAALSCCEGRSFGTHLPRRSQ